MWHEGFKTPFKVVSYNSLKRCIRISNSLADNLGFVFVIYRHSVPVSVTEHYRDSSSL
jgi:hypothetical protein